MKTLMQLKQLVDSQASADDLVSAVIFKSQQQNIPKTRSFFQQAFFDLKRRFPDVFKDFIFDESGITPFSDELDAVLFRLEASTVLSTLNPTYKSYTVANSAKSLEMSYRKFQGEEKLRIDECADALSKLITA